MIYCRTGILPTPLNVLVHARTLMGQLIGIPIVKLLALSFTKLHFFNKLVNTFTEMLQYLTIDMVWVIVKSKPGSGFQTWHQDFNLNEKITKTIVINLGAVKRSDLLGGPLRKVVNSENKDNEAKLSARDILGGHMLCGFINSESKDNEGKVRAMKGKETEQRDDAMAKRNRKQWTQAKKAM